MDSTVWLLESLMFEITFNSKEIQIHYTLSFTFSVFNMGDYILQRYKNCNVKLLTKNGFKQCFIIFTHSFFNIPNGNHIKFSMHFL